jgi:N-acetylglucosaminyldiphosphoundecaprenol N-acetyl-beta-D-mannosaminyltransferase
VECCSIERPVTGLAPPTRVDLLGAPVDVLTMEQTVELAHEAMVTRRPLRHVALNVAKLVKLRRDDDLARDVAESDIVGIDGMGIVHALRLQGVRATRVAGCDLMFALLPHCAQQGLRPYLLGARQDVLDRALAEARKRWPGIVFAGARNGYFGAEEEPAIVAAIRDSGADCLFVAMPTPRKERFLARWSSELGVPFVMGVGGSVDILAGHVSRAPEAWQKTGFEWLHRLLQEPRKMLWRYVSTNSVFAALLAREWVARRMGRRSGATR